MARARSENETDVQPVADDAPAVRDVAPEQAEAWVQVRALEALVGGGRTVERGEVYSQPAEAARYMAAQGWVEIVE